jgi:hypothetical protein
MAKSTAPKSETEQTAANKPKDEIIDPPAGDAAAPIDKPPSTGFSLAGFRSSKSPTIASVATLPVGLPHHPIADAKDWVRLHEDEVKYWSEELCFIDVPIQGQKKSTLHLILEDLAVKHLEAAAINGSAWL